MDKNVSLKKVSAREQNAHESMGLNKFEATFSDKIRVEDFPPSLKPIYNSVQGAGHKDKMLLASLTRISGLITNVYGLYRRQRLYGNLMTLQFAPPAVSRKGEVKETAHLTDKIDNEQLLENEAIMREYSSIVDSWQQEGRTAKGRDSRGLKPKEPAIRRYKIAAKSTSASMYKQLSANDGAGYMMTTEGEVLVKELTKDISDFSELLLYSFQNEFADKSIATDNTHYSMPRIKFSVLLTMPPQAAEKLIKLTLDKGLISRLIIQQLPTNKLEWEDPFAEDGEPLEDIFKKIGDTMVYAIYKEMQRLKDKEIQFVMTPEQKEDFSKTFKEQFDENTQLFGVTFSEFQFRLGVICFKLAMVLSMIKKYDDAQDKSKLFGDDEQSLLCTDAIYNIAKIITITMTRHTLRCYQIAGMKEQKSSLMQDYKMSPQNALLYEEMAENFSSEDVKAWCSEHNASYDTARRWLRNMLDHQLLSRLSPGKFRKLKAV